MGRQNGFTLYRFRYMDDEQVYVGVLAQEVQRKLPAAVARGSDGYLRVNYSLLGLRMVTLAEWKVISEEKPPTAFGAMFLRKG